MCNMYMISDVSMCATMQMHVTFVIMCNVLFVVYRLNPYMQHPYIEHGIVPIVYCTFVFDCSQFSFWFVIIVLFFGVFVAWVD